MVNNDNKLHLVPSLFDDIVFLTRIRRQGGGLILMVGDRRDVTQEFLACVDQFFKIGEIRDIETSKGVSKSFFIMPNNEQLNEICDKEELKTLNTIMEKIRSSKYDQTE